MLKKPSKKYLISAVFIVMAASLSVILPLRIYEYLELMKEGTGFFSASGKIGVYTLYGIIAAVCVVLLIFSRVGSKSHTYSIPKRRNIPVAIVTFLLSFSVISDGVYQAFLVYRSVVSGDNTTAVMSEISNSIVTWFRAAQGVLALLSGVFFFILAMYYCRPSEKDIKKIKLLAVTPVIWECFRLMIRFMNTIDFKKVSELLFEMFMIVFCAMFLVAFIKFMCGYSLPRAQTKLFGYGMIAALFCFVCSVPRYVLVVFSRTQNLYNADSVWQINDLFMGMFILSVLFSIMETVRVKKLAGEEYREV